jgi:porin-like protein
MRETFLVVAALLLVSPVAADPYRAAQPATSANPVKTLPLKGATSVNSCAAYGPGFVKVDGTDTCMKIGGSVSVGVGGASR